MPLKSPAADFSTLQLKIKEFPVTRLRRVGTRDSGEPYFGRRNANRFDDPNSVFGTCYCGEQLDTAIAETILHDEVPDKGEFRILEDVISSRYLVTFAAGMAPGLLQLADLRGHHLIRLGGDNNLSAETPYDVTKLWSAAVHAHPTNVDGFVYVSKQLNTKIAMVIFDRAGPKFGTASYQPLASVRGLAAAKKRLGLVSFGATGIAGATP